MANINNNYNPGKFGNLNIPNQNTGSDQYNFGISQYGEAAGQPPRVFAYDKKGSSGIKDFMNSRGSVELTNDRNNLTIDQGWTRKNSPSLEKELKYYQKLSDSLFKEGKKNINLKFGFN